MTRLISEQDDLQVLTNRRNTDTRTAITRGLAEYMRTLAIDADGGQTYKFEKVFEQIPTSEVDAVFPSASVYSLDTGEYEASNFGPQVVELDSGIAIRKTSELGLVVTAELWTSTPKQRMMMTAMCEYAFNPIEGMYGFVLELPHYHNARALFEMLTIDYSDIMEEDQKNWRKSTFTLKATCPQFVSYDRSLPRLKPRFVFFLDGEEMTGDQNADDPTQ